MGKDICMHLLVCAINRVLLRESRSIGRPPERHLHTSRSNEVVTLTLSREPGGSGHPSGSQNSGFTDTLTTDATTYSERPAWWPTHSDTPVSPEAWKPLTPRFR